MCLFSADLKILQIYGTADFEPVDFEPRNEKKGADQFEPFFFSFGYDFWSQF